MILIRTFNFRRFAFVSKSNSRPQRYNGISETDEVNPEENKLIQRLFVAPWVRLSLLRSVNLESFTLELMSNVKREVSIVFTAH